MGKNSLFTLRYVKMLLWLKIHLNRYKISFSQELIQPWQEDKGDPCILVVLVFFYPINSDFLVPASKIWEMNCLCFVSVLLQALPEFSVAFLCVFAGKLVLSIQMELLQQTFEQMYCLAANIADAYLKPTFLRGCALILDNYLF